VFVRLGDVVCADVEEAVGLHEVVAGPLVGVVEVVQSEEGPGVKVLDQVLLCDEFRLSISLKR
jgi:hypothetical protein